MTQQLSNKEQGLFRTLVKFYEAKQYKKALKTAEQILKKSPDHADTIAMKVRLSVLRRILYANGRLPGSYHQCPRPDR